MFLKNCQQEHAKKKKKSLSYKSVCELLHQNSNYKQEVKTYLFRSQCILKNKVKAMISLLR